MDRRGFFRMLAGASALAAAPVSLYKKLLPETKVPIAVKYIRKYDTFNVDRLDSRYLTIDQFSDKYIKPVMLTHRADFESLFYNGPKIGDTINVRKPIRFMGRVNG